MTTDILSRAIRNTPENEYHIRRGFGSEYTPPEYLTMRSADYSADCMKMRQAGKSIGYWQGIHEAWYLLRQSGYKEAAEVVMSLLNNGQIPEDDNEL